MIFCLHAHATFPQTPVRRGGGRGQTYVVCLDCGREFEYDWQAMKRDAQRDAKYWRQRFLEVLTAASLLQLLVGVWLFFWLRS